MYIEVQAVEAKLVSKMHLVCGTDLDVSIISFTATSLTMDIVRRLN